MAEPAVRLAAKLLGAAHPVAAPSLIAVLQSNQVALRPLVANLLGDIGDTRAVPALIDCLRSPSREMREAAVDALREIGDPRAIPTLICALDDRESDVRAAAAWALERIAERRPAPALRAALPHLRILEHTDPAFRSALARIEAVGILDLPVSAAPPGITAENLPLPAASDEKRAAAPTGWWARLGRRRGADYAV